MRLVSILAAAAAAVIAPAVASADDARVHTFHCLNACPLGAPETADLIVREIYTLSADPLTKLAVWVAYRITPETIGPSQSRDWAPTTGSRRTRLWSRRTMMAPTPR
jgi:endonuclease G